MKWAVLRALTYYDIFDYPLTLEEIWQRVEVSCSFSEIKKTVSLLIKEKQIQKKQGFYFLKGRGEIIRKRQQGEKISQKKLLIAQKIANWLRKFPTIKMIALTGAVSAGSSQKEDDLDFLLVTTSGYLWLTRMGVIFLTKLMGRRPQLKKGKIRDAACFNIFLDENCLKMPKEKQNFFVAHEIIQMKVLWQRDNIYQKFLKKNRWLKNFLPNWRN